MKSKPYISAEELQDLFHRRPTGRHFWTWPMVSAAILITLGVYMAINAPAINQQLNYWWTNDIQAATDQTIPNQPVSNQAGPSDQPTSTPGTGQTSPKQITAINPETLPNNTLYIPKIRVKAPLIWDVSGGKDLNTDLLKALESGVVRYPRTALPNQVGNVFLTGHSSNYWWEKGRYKTVFVLLDRLVVGDTIYIKYQNQLYTYKVNGQKVVKPSETSVLAPTKTATLSLMTCTPTGTSLLRRIVTADLVSPTEGLQLQTTKPTDAMIHSVR